MQACAVLQAPRASVVGISNGKAPRGRATTAVRRSTVATAHPAPADDQSFTRRTTLITGLSGAALLAAPQCAHISPLTGPLCGYFRVCAETSHMNVSCHLPHLFATCRHCESMLLMPMLHLYPDKVMYRSSQGSSFMLPCRCFRCRRKRI